MNVDERYKKAVSEGLQCIVVKQRDSMTDAEKVYRKMCKESNIPFIRLWLKERYAEFSLQILNPNRCLDGLVEEAIIHDIAEHIQLELKYTKARIHEGFYQEPLLENNITFGFAPCIRPDRLIERMYNFASQHTIPYAIWDRDRHAKNVDLWNNAFTNIATSNVEEYRSQKGE